jgi:hypothetical protein
MRSFLIAILLFIPSVCFGETRYYICPIIGDGSDENWYRPTISDVARQNKIRIGYDVEIRMVRQEVGATPASNWALVMVNATGEEHGILEADSDIFQLPDLSPTDKMSAVSLAEKNALNTKLQALGMDDVNVNDTYRTFIKSLGVECMQVSEEQYNVDAFMRIE